MAAGTLLPLKPFVYFDKVAFTHFSNRLHLLYSSYQSDIEINSCKIRQYCVFVFVSLYLCLCICVFVFASLYLCLCIMYSDCTRCSAIAVDWRVHIWSDHSLASSGAAAISAYALLLPRPTLLTREYHCHHRRYTIYNTYNTIQYTQYIKYIINTYRVFFFNWYPPKKLKYVKPRLGESTLA